MNKFAATDTGPAATVNKLIHCVILPLGHRKTFLMPPVYVLPFSQQGCQEEPSEAERTNYAPFDFMEFTELLSPKHFFFLLLLF